MKEITEHEAYLRLAAACAQAEHCEQEMRERMRRWGMDQEAAERVTTRLVKERYVDDERYAQAYVKDKIRYQKWGRRKVEQGLWTKRIDEDIRRRVLDGVDDEEYLSVLRPMLKQKQRGIKAASDWELRQKLVRWAMGRGYTLDVIRQCMDTSDVEIEDEDDL